MYEYFVHDPVLGLILDFYTATSSICCQERVIPKIEIK